ncbi:MAG: isochorismatase family protein [Holophaga sp.]|nr:isochorismatase family protein [Holophaga sp.]
MLPRNIALLLIAAQQAWDDPYWGQRNNPEAEANQAQVLQAFRAGGLCVVHVQSDARDPNSPLHPGEPGHAFKPGTAPKPGETVLHQSGHCAFNGTGLERLLRDQGIDRLVLAGFTTSHCISSSARTACELGFKTVVLSDACVAFELEDVAGNRMPAELLHTAGLAELHGEFAMVLPTAAILQLL